MPRPSTSSRRPGSRLKPSSEQNKAPIVYIIIVALMVFSLVFAGLSTVDWSSLFASKAEPTPDPNVDAIALQQTAVAQNPDDVDAQALLATMLANSGRIQEAIPVYERAIHLDPDNAAVRLDFARSLQSNNMTQDAESQFLKVLEMEPNDHTAHYYLARLYLGWQPRRLDEAIAHFNRVIEIAPDSFLAEQAQSALDTLGQSTPIALPATPE